MKSFALSVCFLLFTAFSLTSTHADETKTKYDRVHFSVSSSTQVENDTMTAEVEHINQQSTSHGPTLHPSALQTDIYLTRY